MQPDKAIDVRQVLQQNSYTTTVDELRSRGKRRVRVINAEQISALIEEAVNRMISSSSGMGREEVKKLVERSREEFRRLLTEREKELGEHKERLRRLDQTRSDFAKATGETERLRIVETELRGQVEGLTKQVSELQAAAKKETQENSEAHKAEVERLQRAEAEARKETEAAKAALEQVRKTPSKQKLSKDEEAELERLRKIETKAQKEKEAFLGRMAELRRTEAELRRAESESRREKEQMLGQIGDMKKAIEQLASKKAEDEKPAAPPPEMVEMMKSISFELASMKSELKEAASKPDKTADAADRAVAEKMEEFSKGLAERLDKIGKKVGVSVGMEAEEVRLDNIFTDQEELESNIENVEVKERRGSGISGALEKIRSLRKKKGDKKG